MEQNLVVWTENESKQTEQNLFNDPANEQLMAMLYSGAGNVLDVMLEFKQLMFAASAAMKIVKTKLEILDTEFQMTHNRDPIHMIQTRLKTQASIMEKLTRKGLEPTTANMEAYVSDIAGVRVICRYMDDIYLQGESKQQRILHIVSRLLSHLASIYRTTICCII